MSSAGTNITFDSNDLQTSSILTQNISHAGIPNKNANSYSLAHANKSVIPFVSYPSRTITIKGTILGTNISDLDTKLDTFRAYFNGQDRNLDIGYGGSTRRYVATANSITIDRPGGLVHAEFEIEFICTLPFGIETSATSALSASGRTLGNYNDNYTFGGTAPFQVPIVTLTMTTIADSDTRQVLWGNGSNGQVIVINRVWTSGDVLLIDCDQKTVTVNGSPISFTGAFPAFAAGAQVFQYTDSFTSRTFSVDVSYTKRYM